MLFNVSFSLRDSNADCNQGTASATPQRVPDGTGQSRARHVSAGRRETGTETTATTEQSPRKGDGTIQSPARECRETRDGDRNHSNNRTESPVRGTGQSRARHVRA